jgi:hypothetical protein
MVDNNSPDLERFFGLPTGRQRPGGSNLQEQTLFGLLCLVARASPKKSEAWILRKKLRRS